MVLPPFQSVARPSSSSLQKNYASAVFLAAIALVLLANVYQIVVLDIRPSTESAGSALLESFAVSKVTPTTTTTTQHRVAGLSCAKYGGPDDVTAAEMIYWRDIPSDASWVSPLAAPSSLGVQYLTFEPDEGGWNNIRMALETAVVLALATGRTLVLPPQQTFYLLNQKHEEKEHKTTFGFDDFYHFDSVLAEHAGLNILTFEEFLKREAMNGHLIDHQTKLPSFPPENRTNWNNLPRNWESAKGGHGKALWGWLRSVTTNLDWDYGRCLAAFPAQRGPEGIAQLKQAHEQWLKQDEEKFKAEAERLNVYRWRLRMNTYDGKPTPVDASTVDRMAEMMAERKEICIYDEFLQNEAKVVHLRGEQSSGFRLLVHFYAFVFFADWKHDLWAKRFVRDHLRYMDEIQCAAARVVAAVRKIAREHAVDGSNPTGRYDSFHIRRGDFQYKEMHISADEIYQNNTKAVLKEGTTVFVATDERKKEFFDPLRQHYKLVFLDDFMDQITDINPNYYGMLDQLVASRGDTFFGAYLSTFTGYINRVRGYHAQKDKGTGYEHGIINSFYYAPEAHRRIRRIMRKYVSIRQGFWQQEFPVCWRDIDHDVELR